MGGGCSEGKETSRRKMAATQPLSCHHLSPVTFFNGGVTTKVAEGFVVVAKLSHQHIFDLLFFYQIVQICVNFLVCFLNNNTNMDLG